MTHPRFQRAAILPSDRALARDVRAYLGTEAPDIAISRDLFKFLTHLTSAALASAQVVLLVTPNRTERHD